MYSCTQCAWTGDVPFQFFDEFFATPGKPLPEVAHSHDLYCPICGGSVALNEQPPQNHTQHSLLTNDLADLVTAIGIPLIFIGILGIIPTPSILAQCITITIGAIGLLIGLMLVRNRANSRHTRYLGIRLLIISSTATTIIVINWLMTQLGVYITTFTWSIDLTLILVGAVQIIFSMSLSIFENNKKKH